MPGSFTVTTAGLQSATLELDGGTKPATTGHYLIQRRPNGAAASEYLTIYKTTSATVYDHPRPRSSVGEALTDTQLLWAYRAYSYITALSAYGSPVEDDDSTAGYGIAGISNSASDATAYIDPSSVAEPTIEVGGVISTISNTYLAQAEVISYPDNAYDRDSWTVTKVIPLAVSSA